MHEEHAQGHEDHAYHNHGHSHGHSHSHGHQDDDSMPTDFGTSDMIVKLENTERDVYHHWEVLIARLKQHTGRSDGTLVGVDLGGGTGYLARKFSEAPSFVRLMYSADVAPLLIEYAKQKVLEKSVWSACVVPVLCSADLVQLPEKVDFAICVNVLHHLPDPALYFRGLLSVCSEQCVLLVVDYKPERLERNGEEFGPKMAWNVKIGSDKLAQLVASEWQLLEVVEFEYHYNAFFRRK